MGVLELDIPPIELHASTQCDIRTVEKAKFLSDVGFTQIVLARELNLNQIRDIRGRPTRPLNSLSTVRCVWPIPGSVISLTPRRGAARTGATALRPAVCRIP